MRIGITRTLDCIQGSTVRGALAAFYLGCGNHVDNTFRRLFVTGEVSYGNLYQDGALPIPLTARSCKYEPGFIADQGHGVVDVLLPWFAQQGQEASDPTLSDHSCAQCGAPLERYNGFYSRTTPHRSASTIKLRQILTRTAIDPRHHTAAEGSLYSLEVLDPTAAGASPTFLGTIICATKESVDVVNKELVAPLFSTDAPRLFVGTARSRGLGEVEVRDCQPGDAPLRDPLIDRLHVFNGWFRGHGLDHGRTYFSLTLESDAIIQDEFFRFHNIIPASLLIEGMGMYKELIDHVKLEFDFTETQTIAGWNAALRAPKNDALAIKKGAAFLYSIRGIPEQDLLAGLTHIDSYGVGERRAEGFGRVIVCDQFHVAAA